MYRRDFIVDMTVNLPGVTRFFTRYRICDLRNEKIKTEHGLYSSKVDNTSQQIQGQGEQKPDRVNRQSGLYNSFSPLDQPSSHLRRRYDFRYHPVCTRRACQGSHDPPLSTRYATSPAPRDQSFVRSWQLAVSLGSPSRMFHLKQELY